MVFPFEKRTCPMSSVPDAGKAVAKIFMAGPPKYADNAWPMYFIASDKLTFEEYAKQWSEASGVQTDYVDMSLNAWMEMMTKAFIGMKIPDEMAKTMAQDMGNMFLFQGRCDTYKGNMDTKKFRELVPDAEDF